MIMESKTYEVISEVINLRYTIQNIRRFSHTEIVDVF